MKQLLTLILLFTINVGFSQPASLTINNTSNEGVVVKAHAANGCIGTEHSETVWHYLIPYSGTVTFAPTGGDWHEWIVVEVRNTSFTLGEDALNPCVPDCAVLPPPIDAYAAININWDILVCGTVEITN